MMRVSNEDMRGEAETREGESKTRDEGSKNTINYTWRDDGYRGLPFKFAERESVECMS